MVERNKYLVGAVIESGSFLIFLHDDLNPCLSLDEFGCLCATFKSFTSFINVAIFPLPPVLLADYFVLDHKLSSFLQNTREKLKCGVLVYWELLDYFIYRIMCIPKSIKPIVLVQCPAEENGSGSNTLFNGFNKHAVVCNLMLCISYILYALALLKILISQAVSYMEEFKPKIKRKRKKRHISLFSVFFLIIIMLCLIDYCALSILTGHGLACDTK